MNITILGSGLVGAPMAIDLAADSQMHLRVVYIDLSALQRIEDYPSIDSVCEDLSNPLGIQKQIADADFVINALPGYMGYRTLKTVIEAGRNIVDISFFPENPLELHDLANIKGITAIVDCGVAPGMSNLLVGFADSQLDHTENVRIYVGGLPMKKEGSFEYKAVFSISDVLEEYIRPSRYIKDGRLVTKPALSEPETIDFDRVGSLEAFNTDGLRTLASTIPAANIIEKTLRYPGHINLIKVFRDAGFLSKEAIRVRDVDLVPFDVTSHILSEEWRMKPEDRDFTVMRIIVEGMKGGQNLRYLFELYDRFDEKTGVHSMARTTGYTATMALRMLVDNLFHEKGIIAPEQIGRNSKCVNYMLRGLKQRGITYSQKLEEI